MNTLFEYIIITEFYYIIITVTIVKKNDSYTLK